VSAPRSRAEIVLAWLLRLAALSALAGFALATWFGGPMIRYGDSAPFEAAWVRGAIVAAAILLVLCNYLLHRWQARRAEGRIEEAIARSDAAGSDADLLEARMREAIATLKREGAGRNFLYELPWYLIIGPPGAGKTTALVNSGLRFPLAGQEEAQALGGVGGTRNCDWWFTEEAILIDTAGRYTTQDSDTEADRKSWLAFLAILKRHRPRQPVNGIIVAISLSDLMTLDGNELGTHVSAIRERLQEIRDALKIECPVYVLFTKADLVAGFREYFAGFDETRRWMVWGTTFPPKIEGGDPRGEVAGGFAALVARLAYETADRLQEEVDPFARTAIFGFPAQFGLLKERVADFLSAVFDAPGGTRRENLRGFYFSSGTQEGTPIDQFLGAISRSFGGDARPRLSGTGKSFFLHDLLSRVVFAEAPLVSYDPAASRRAVLGRYAFIGAAGLLLVAAVGAIGLSFVSNKSMIDATARAMDRYRAVAGPVLAKPVIEPDLENVAEPLEMLRNLPVGYSNADMPAPWQAGFGIGQHDALLSASQEAYRLGLERMLRPRLLLEAEDAVRKNLANPIGLYEPLKIYLMLGGEAPRADDDLIVSWMTHDWEQGRFPGPANRQGRVDLARHVRAMLALDDAYDPLYKPDASLVAAARRSLDRMPLAERAEAVLSAALNRQSPGDFPLGGEAGPQGGLVFDTADGADISGLTVPALYTSDGFNRFYLPALADVAQTLTGDQWVFGDKLQGADLDAALPQLGPKLLDRYAADFAAAWNATLARLRLKPLAAGKPQYLSLAAAASPDSPIRLLFQAIAAETSLTPQDAVLPSEGRQAGKPDISQADLERGLARIGIDMAGRKSQNRAGDASALAAASGVVPGAAIDARFRPFHLLVEGRPGQRPIDALVQNFHDIYQSLLVAASGSGQGSNASLPLKLQSLRLNATRLPKPLAGLVLTAADEFEGNAAETSLERLNKSLARTVTAPCREALDNRYPFAAGSAKEVSLADFARLFAPGGIIDKYFAQHLAPLVDMGGQDWQWRRETPLGQQLSGATLKQFQAAAAIRDAFFRPGETMPAIRITIAPASLNADIDMALLSVDAQIVQSYQTGSTASTVNWPGDASGSANLSFTPALPGRQSVLGFQGQWAIRRLLEAGAVTPNGDAVDVRFVIGGRDASYTIRTDPAPDPFLLPALSSFTCPSGF
jgi:type VI secretion system protein ImpL